MDCSLPRSSVHGIFQARVLERGAVAFSPIKLNASILNRHTHVTQMRLRKTATISSFPDLQSPLPMPKTLCLSNSLIAQLVKKPPAMRGTWVWTLGGEDPLEKWKATHSSTLGWTIPWTVHGVAKSRTRLSDFHFHFTGHRHLQGVGFLGYKPQHLSIWLVSCMANGPGLVVRGIIQSYNTCAPLPRFWVYILRTLMEDQVHLHFRGTL